MIIRFYYRQLFSFFFLLALSIIVILDAMNGRNTLLEPGGAILVFGMSFGFGCFGLIINFIINLTFASELYVAR